MVAETMVPGSGKEPETSDDMARQEQQEQQHEYSVTARSLLEEEEDDDEDDADEVLSRNPSLILEDDDEDGMGRANGHATGDRVDVENPANTSFLEEHTENFDVEGGAPMCQGDMNLLPGGCHSQALAEQMDFMTRCQHPMELFSIFQEHPNREAVEELLPGMYSIPKDCEYCGAEDTKHCHPYCDRPKLYLQKKRPPFCPPDPSRWDSVTECEVTAPKATGTLEPSPVKRRESFLEFTGSLFGRVASTTNKSV